MKEEPHIERLISKWLDNEISESEMSLLKEHKDYQAFEKIKTASSNLKLGEYDKNKEFERLQSRLNASKKSKSTPFLKWIAAAILIGIVAGGLYTTQLFSDQMVETQLSSLYHSLPDQSSVHLNKNSSISYNESDYSDERIIELKGEAFFEVNKGKRFVVKTASGNIEVLGTKFNVISLGNTLTVSCFEGRVKVTSEGKEYILNPKDEIFIDEQGAVKENVNYTNTPSWITGEYVYDNQPLRHVLKDLSDNYNIKIEATKDVAQLKFSGGFDKNNFDQALQSIALPLGLEHNEVGDKILFSKKD
ncbi:MAG: FecR family protein [Nonlabens sp.]|uniref:FecR family protein n=1 Tax=Nonlabens sp. TaxID=1888209 RepID=UPI003EFAF252